MAKRKKKGHVAIPFLITLLIGILLIGGVAMFIFRNLGINDINVIEWNSTVKKPTEADNMTLLFVLDEPADPEPLTFLTARVMPADKKMVFICFPANMLSVVDGRQDTLAGFYENGGIQAAEAAIESEAGITTDRYLILNSAAFQKICNIFAGVYYQVPAGTAGFTDSAEAQYLGPGQMEKLITYPLFEMGETERSPMVADIITEMVNQAGLESEQDGYKRIIDSMDNNFKTLVNMMETDITSLDYNDKKSALKYMYTYGSNIASFRIATGENGEEDDVFMLNGDFKNSVKDLFANSGSTETQAASE